MGGAVGKLLWPAPTLLLPPVFGNRASYHFQSRQEAFERLEMVPSLRLLEIQERLSRSMERLFRRKESLARGGSVARRELAVCAAKAIKRRARMDAAARCREHAGGTDKDFLAAIVKWERATTAMLTAFNQLPEKERNLLERDVRRLIASEYYQHGGLCPLVVVVGHVEGKVHHWLSVGRVVCQLYQRRLFFGIAELHPYSYPLPAIELPGSVEQALFEILMDPFAQENMLRPYAQATALSSLEFVRAAAASFYGPATPIDVVDYCQQTDPWAPATVLAHYMPESKLPTKLKPQDAQQIAHRAFNALFQCNAEEQPKLRRLFGHAQSANTAPLAIVPSL